MWQIQCCQPQHWQVPASARHVHVCAVSAAVGVGQCGTAIMSNQVLAVKAGAWTIVMNAYRFDGPAGNVCMNRKAV
jgi:hypothetical protein